MVVLSVPDARTGKRDVSVLEPMFGGGGATSKGDGPSAIDSAAGFLKNTPMERMEAHIPVLAERYELLPDSAGAGEQRGGWGTRFDFRILRPESIVTARGIERTRFEPWGIAGGAAAQRTQTVVNAGREDERVIGRIDVMHLEPGDVVSIRATGGGGYGDSLRRDPELVAADVRSGLLTENGAARDYGVVVCEGIVDAAATTARRAERVAASQYAARDLGPSRRAYEKVWSDERSRALASFLMSLPQPFRAYAKRALHRRVDQEPEGAPETMEGFGVLWEEIAGELGEAG